MIKENRLLDGEYVEAYAGGAAIGLELLFHDYVSRIHINDLSSPFTPSGTACFTILTGFAN